MNQLKSKCLSALGSSERLVTRISLPVAKHERVEPAS
jgi:hypothetical protein